MNVPPFGSSPTDPSLQAGPSRTQYPFTYNPQSIPPTALHTNGANPTLPPHPSPSYDDSIFQKRFSAQYTDGERIHDGSTLQQNDFRDGGPNPDDYEERYPLAETVESAGTEEPAHGEDEGQQKLDTFLEDFWTEQIKTVEDEPPGSGSLPLARIKKVMKSDEDVRMISAEVPAMFSKACEIFISELTRRAWLVAESNKRRTLQKSDVAAAIGLSDMYDFLVDIVPRDDEGDGGGKATGPVAEHGDGVNGETREDTAEAADSQ